MPIDPNTIKPGDTVRVRLHTHSMEKAGVDPIEFTTKAYAGYDGAPCVADSFLYSNPSALTILEHIPARPDWGDALVIHAKGLGYSNDHLIRDGMGLFNSVGNSRFTVDELREYEVTVVIDADGNPPRPEWLDAGALDELDDHSVALPRDRDMPRYRFEGRWYTSTPDAHGLKAEQIAPARLLWAPDA